MPAAASLRVRVPALLVLGLLAALPALAQPTARLDTTRLGLPFARYTTADRFGRTITFYLACPREGGPRPLALVVLGSGAESAWQRVGDRVGGGLQNLVYREARGRVCALVTEKPGVAYLASTGQPGGAEGAPPAFLEEHTLERWGEANAAAVRAAWTLPTIDPARTLAVGHSEGGIVAARVAALLPTVTHVASLAGGGPSQLFDLLQFASAPQPGDSTDAARVRRQSVLDEWARIQADSMRVDRFWMGHPYRRWGTFLPHSVTGELLRSRARVYLAQGTADAAVSVLAHDAAVADLRTRGRDVTEERIEGVDHSFGTPNAPGPPTGLSALIGRVLTWFAGPPP